MAPKRLELIETEEGWTLPIADQKVTRCCIDYAAVSLLLSNGVSIYIESDFAFALPGTPNVTLDPDGEAVALAPILRLRRLLVTGAEAGKDGSLEVRFEGGGRISVRPDRRFEAWNIAGPGGLRVVSLPGGELAIWAARE